MNGRINYQLEHFEIFSFCANFYLLALPNIAKKMHLRALILFFLWGSMLRDPPSLDSVPVAKT